MGSQSADSTHRCTDESSCVEKRHTSRPQRPYTIRLDIDERARIPFAMIGALILVSSVGTVGVLESRPSTEATVDPSVAIDRTGAAAETALREATLDALEQAGRAPVTAVNDDHWIGEAIGEDETFERYVKTRIYLEALETIPTAGQHLRDDVETTASVYDFVSEADENFLDERIDLEIGTDRSALDRGSIRVTMQVRIEATQDDIRVGHRTAEISTVVATPLFELHEKTDEYDDRLDRGFFDEDTVTGYEGLGRYTAARLYPLAYFKTGYDRARSHEADEQAFADVLPNEHVEVMTNHAAFSIQEAVFGTNDRHSGRVMRGPWACLAADVAHAVGDNYDFNESDDSESSEDGENDSFGNQTDGDTGSDDAAGPENTSNRNASEEEVAGGLNLSIGDFVDAEDINNAICHGGVQERVFGDQTGELPSPPSVGDMATDRFGDMDTLEETDTVRIDPFADVGYYDTKGISNYHDRIEQSVAFIDEDYREDVAATSPIPDSLQGEIDDAIADIYEVSVSSNSFSSRSGSMPSAPDPGGNYTLAGSSTTVTDVAFTDLRHSTMEYGASYDRTIQRFDIEIQMNVVNEKDWVDYWTHEFDWFHTTTRDRSTFTYHVTIEIDADYDNGATAMTGPIVNDFTPGGPTAGDDNSHAEASDGNEFTDARNFNDVLRYSAEDLLAISSMNSMVRDLEHRVSHYEGASSPPSAGAIENRMLASQSATYDHTDLEETDALYEWLEAELTATRSHVKENVEPLSVERVELIGGSPPYDELVDNLDETLIYDDPNDVTYGSVPEKVRAEVRHLYLDNIEHWIGELGDEHENRQDQFEEAFDDVADRIDSPLEQGTDFAHRILAGEVSEDVGAVRSSPLTGDETITVSSSPTYLPLEPINRSVDPAIRLRESTPRELSATKHAGLASRYDNRLEWPGAPIIPYPPGLWLLQLNSWRVEVEGEYSRFEASASTGEPTSSTALTYVREARPVELRIGSERMHIGYNEPVTLSSSIEVVVAQPGLAPMQRGAPPGVGDAGDDGDYHTECSETWDHVGPEYEDNTDPSDRGVVDACENFEEDRFPIWDR